MADNLATFTGDTVKANIGQIMWSLKNLTAVEFRMWVNHCNGYGSFDPSHFEGLEDRFIKYGSWEFTADRDVKEKVNG